MRLPVVPGRWFLISRSPTLIAGRVRKRRALVSDHAAEAAQRVSMSALLRGLSPGHGIRAMALPIRDTSGAGITAFAGGGQASATLMNFEFNRVTVSAATVPPYDSVALPPSLVGYGIIVVNATANTIQVFGSGADT